MYLCTYTIIKSYAHFSLREISAHLLLMPTKLNLMPFLRYIKEKGWNILSTFGGAAWHVGSWFPNQGSNPHPLHWKCTVLNTGPLGKSLSAVFSNSLSPDAFMLPKETKSQAVFKHLIPVSTQISPQHPAAIMHCLGCHIRTLDFTVRQNLSSHGSENKTACPESHSSLEAKEVLVPMAAHPFIPLNSQPKKKKKNL